MIKLSEIVAQYLDEQNLGEAEYARAYRFANRAVKELNWDITGEVKVVEVVAEDDKTILLPTDLIKILDFGISNHNNGISSYSRVDIIKPNTSVPLYEDDFYLEYGDNPNSLYNQQDWAYGGYALPNNFPLGLGSYNTIGEYAVSDDGLRIVVSPDSQYNHFLLKYLANSDCVDAVDEMLAPAIVAYIKWKALQVVNKYSTRDVEYFKSEFLREKKLAKLRIKSFTTQQMNELSRRSVKMGMKS